MADVREVTIPPSAVRFKEGAEGRRGGFDLTVAAILYKGRLWRSARFTRKRKRTHPNCQPSLSILITESRKASKRNCKGKIKKEFRSHRRKLKRGQLDFLSMNVGKRKGGGERKGTDYSP